jgi:5-methylcytosine-specific restriction endonuclease McrA
MIKTCTICGKEFNTQKLGRGRKFCYDCVPAYCKTWAERTSAKMRAMRKEGLRILCGVCLKCGEAREYTIDFHHINPKDKISTLSYFMSSGDTIGFFLELAKCIPLCANCHRHFHHINLESGISLEEYVPNLSEFKPLVSCVNHSFKLNKPSMYSYVCTNCGKDFVLKEESKTGICCVCLREKTRKVERPLAEVLYNEILNSSFVTVGKKYGVSNVAIRKWCKTYKLPTSSKEYRELRKIGEPTPN